MLGHAEVLGKCNPTMLGGRWQQELEAAQMLPHRAGRWTALAGASAIVRGHAHGCGRDGVGDARLTLPRDGVSP